MKTHIFPNGTSQTCKTANDDRFFDDIKRLPIRNSFLLVDLIRPQHEHNTKKRPSNIQGSER